MEFEREMQTIGDCRSTTCTLFFVDIGVITWKCKTQPTIALSTTEVEYMAISDCT